MIRSGTTQQIETQEQREQKVREDIAKFTIFNTKIGSLSSCFTMIHERKSEKDIEDINAIFSELLAMYPGKKEDNKETDPNTAAILDIQISFVAFTSTGATLFIDSAKQKCSKLMNVIVGIVADLYEEINPLTRVRPRQRTDLEQSRLEAQARAAARGIRWIDPNNNTDDEFELNAQQTILFRRPPQLKRSALFVAADHSGHDTSEDYDADIEDAVGRSASTPSP